MPLRDATRYTNFKHSFSTKTSLAFRAVRCGQKKTYHDFLNIFSISILITILTQTDMLYSYKCILCDFETYFQRKPNRPFPKSCNISLEHTYGKINVYIYYMWVIKSNKTTCNMHFFLAIKSFSCSELIFPVSLAYYLSVWSVCSVLALNLGMLHSDWFGLHTAGGWGRGRGKNRAIKRFRNSASSNQDFISIPINRTALLAFVSVGSCGL